MPHAPKSPAEDDAPELPSHYEHVFPGAIFSFLLNGFLIWLAFQSSWPLWIRVLLALPFIVLVISVSFIYAGVARLWWQNRQTAKPEPHDHTRTA